MIGRFYLKEFLTFKESEIEFKPGLNVFTGPSGSGKSIFMRSILSSFSLDNVEAHICEAEVNWKIDEETFGIENEETNIFKLLRKDKISYFINNQKVSKATIEKICFGNIRHLSLKDYSDFEENSLINLIDERISKSLPKHTELITNFKSKYFEWKKNKDELKSIEEQEKKLSELKEFAEYEINKISTINPKVGEDEELMEIKKQLSKKEKIQEVINNAEGIFNFDGKVSTALNTIDIDSSFFDDTMNELRNVFDLALDKLNDLENTDIEEILTRIEEISELKKRFGSIEETLIYKNEKMIELEGYQNIEYSKSELINKINDIEKTLNEMSNELSINRGKYIVPAKNKLNEYLTMLYLRPAILEIEKRNINENGEDKIIIGLEGTKLEKLSSGEFNRLRLAILALKAESMDSQNGVLMLDEIDANLSGEESMSVAKVLRHLSSKYQIFVVSHQPQLTSMGDNHYLITKDNESHIKQLNNNERIDEIARIISGDSVSNEAKLFAKDLFEKSQKR
jgi:DNA repair protein RecN (Recombination protein N)